MEQLKHRKFDFSSCYETAFQGHIRTGAAFLEMHKTASAIKQYHLVSEKTCQLSLVRVSDIIYVQRLCRWSPRRCA